MSLLTNRRLALSAFALAFVCGSPLSGVGLAVSPGEDVAAEWVDPTLVAEEYVEPAVDYREPFYAPLLRSATAVLSNKWVCFLLVQACLPTVTSLFLTPCVRCLASVFLPNQPPLYALSRCVGPCIMGLPE